MAYTCVRSGPAPVSIVRDNHTGKPVPPKKQRRKNAKMWCQNYKKMIKMGQNWVDIVGHEKSQRLADKLRIYLNYVQLDYNEYIIKKTGAPLYNSYFEDRARYTQQIPSKKTFTDLLREIKAEDEDKAIKAQQVSVVASLRDSVVCSKLLL